jgi:hypothetical protein
MPDGGTVSGLCQRALFSGEDVGQIVASPSWRREWPIKSYAAQLDDGVLLMPRSPTDDRTRVIEAGRYAPAPQHSRGD